MDHHRPKDHPSDRLSSDKWPRCVRPSVKRDRRSIKRGFRIMSESPTPYLIPIADRHPPSLINPRHSGGRRPLRQMSNVFYWKSGVDTMSGRVLVSSLIWRKFMMIRISGVRSFGVTWAWGSPPRDLCVISCRKIESRFGRIVDWLLWELHGTMCEFVSHYMSQW